VIDAMDYISRLEDLRSPPPLLSREDMVVLALADDNHSAGLCAACGAIIEADRWCPECAIVAKRFSINQSTVRQRTDKQRWSITCCEDCGELFARKGRANRCLDCAPRHKKARRNELAKQKRLEAWSKKRCVTCGEPLDTRRAVLYCSKCSGIANEMHKAQGRERYRERRRQLAEEGA
jgi:hypothetical protein